MERYGRGSEGRRISEASLRALARQQLPGASVFMLANAEPYRHEAQADGTTIPRRSTSGLVTAVEPLIRATGGTWIASTAAAHSADHDSDVDVPPDEPQYRLRRVRLTSTEIQRYYEGFANEGLWPLCHRAHVRPYFRGDDFETYRAVNHRFVDQLPAGSDVAAPLVIVQDYHLALAPHMVRDRLPASTIVGFWHIPWPTWQVFETCPWKREIIEGLLGADILGFQTPGDCENFLEAAERTVDARVWPHGQSITYGGRRTEVHAYPTSIEWPSRLAAEVPPAPACRDDVRYALGLAPDALLSVSAARLDYTKGIEEACCAIERLLERHPEYRGRLTHVQLAAPSRTQIAAYRELAERVADAAGRVNRRFSHGSYRPVVVLRSDHEPRDVYRYLRAADVCYVPSVHDGMNLVAKEFVAARDDERGALVLSIFTGTAWQLPDALIVNPYDLDDVVAAIVRGLGMSHEEQQERLSRMRESVADDNAYTWAAAILADVAELQGLRHAEGHTPIRL